MKISEEEGEMGRERRGEGASGCQLLFHMLKVSNLLHLSHIATDAGLTNIKDIRMRREKTQVEPE